MFNQTIYNVVILLPLTAIVTYYDTRYRRIPNRSVMVTLVIGLALNSLMNGWPGTLASLAGCFIAFGLMLVLHLVGALGAGDVKLFASIGSVIGAHLVLPTFAVILMTGGVLAVLTALRAGTMRETAQRVSLIFGSLLVNFSVPRFYVPEDQKQTVPYGVAITFGSLISLAIFRA
jgi:prepilin peptidase CpaA